MPVFPLKMSMQRNLLCAAIGCTLATLLLGSAPVRAQDSFEAKILDGVMGAIGLSRKQDNIEYRERSPLVLPPSANVSLGDAGTLPPPQTDKMANPNWPVDPEVKEARALAKDDGQNSSARFEANAQPMRPSELERGRTNRTQNNQNNGQQRAPRVTPSELGYTGGVFGSMFGSGQPGEFAAFTSEPTRSNLTEPPAGYQTPSPNQPYAVGKAGTTFKEYDYMDRKNEK